MFPPLQHGYFINGKVGIIHVFLVQELKRFPTLQADLAAAANAALERFRDASKKYVLFLVDMESSYLTVDFFRRLPQEGERVGNPTAAAVDRYTEDHFKAISTNVSSYISQVCDSFRRTIPKAVVHCQVRQAKQALLDHFYTKVGRYEVFISLFVYSLL